jgi:hypothetical protein
LLSANIASSGDGSGEVTAHDRVVCSTPAGSDPFATAGAENLELDRARLERAVSYATARGAQSVRIYRHGCLVAR